MEVGVAWLRLDLDACFQRELANGIPSPNSPRATLQGAAWLAL